MVFFKKKQKKGLELKAYVSGKVIPITQVADPVFSSGTLGDGIAIQPEEDLITAPCDGEVSMVADTGHAMGITLDNGAQLIIHIGLDTVEMNGKGFEVLAAQGTKVKQGMPLVKFDRKLIEENGFLADCILVMVNRDQFPDVRFISGMDAERNETVIAVI